MDMHETRALVAFMVIAVGTACRPDGRGVPADSSAASGSTTKTPAPAFVSFDRAPIDSIIDYAQSLQYDPDIGVSDLQALAVYKPGGTRCPEGCTYGPVVAIQPQVGAAFLTDDELKVGRVIARFVNEDTLAYDKLNISPRSTTYYVVVNTGAAQWTGYFVSTDPARGSLSRVPHPVYVDQPHAGRYPRSAARWIWMAEDETAWTTCGWKCCRTSP
jgi:hypothetical protein